MTDLMPIEPGCLALTYGCIHPDNNGKTVKVGQFIGRIDGWYGSDWWEIDKPMVDAYGRHPDIYASHEYNLLRIGGHIPEPTTQEEEVEA